MSRNAATAGREGLFAVLVWTGPMLFLACLGWLLADLLLQGTAAWTQSADHTTAGFWSAVVEFLTQAPRDAGREGGIFPVLVSTILLLAVCMTVALPLGLATAILLSEFLPPHHRFGRLVQRSLDVLAAVPSIVFGLFGNAVFCQWLGLRFSILAGGLTLACMVLPLLIRACEQGLRGVPAEHRRAAAALGLSRWTTLCRVVLPQASGGVAVGLVLGIGRALAETAALIFTSGYVDRLPRSLLDSGRSLSIHVYELAANVPGGTARAAASALVLVVLLLVINAATAVGTRRLLARHGGPPLFSQWTG